METFNFTKLDRLKTDNPIPIELIYDHATKRCEIRKKILELYKNTEDFKLISEIISEINNSSHPMFYKLLFACEKGRLELVKTCVFELSKTNKSFDFTEPYLKARQFNHQEIVDYFESRGASLTEEDIENYKMRTW